MTDVDSISGQRVAFWQGQWFDAAGLRNAMATDALMLGWHLRGMHRTWGIVFGMAVTPSLDHLQVLVSPGVAYDCHGREIILADAIELPVPKIVHEGKSVLVARYSSRPCWVSPEEVHFGEDLPLVSYSSTPTPTFDSSARRYAQPLAPRHVGWGVQTKLELIQSPEGGLECQIDTSRGKFVQTPIYFASICSSASIFAFESIFDESPIGFTLSLFGSPVNAAIPVDAAVFWIGVEPSRGAEPAVNFAQIFQADGKIAADAAERWRTILMGA